MIESKPKSYIPPNKEDYDLLTHYIAFSSEVMKFSILIITAIWAVLIAIYKKPAGGFGFYEANISIVAVLAPVFLLMMAIGFSLAHRYVAVNSVANWMHLIRKEEETSKILRDRSFSLARLFILLSPLFLFLGIVATGILLWILLV